MSSISPKDPEQRTFHGSIGPGDLARGLIAEFNRGNLRAQQLGTPDHLIVQIQTARAPASGGRTGISVHLIRVEDGVLVSIGEQELIGVAASLGATALAVLAALRNPLALVTRLDDLAGLMSEVNGHLVQSTPAGIFATLFVGLLDTATGRLRYVNGGHPAPMLLRAVASEPVLLSEGGPLVGILPGAPFTVGEVALAPGDMLLIYSDGLSEAMDAEQRMFEESGVLRALEAARSLDAEPVLHAVLDAADRFVAGSEQSDDISLVVARRTVAAPHGTDRCEPDSRAEPWQQG